MVGPDGLALHQTLNDHPEEIAGEGLKASVEKQ